MFNSNLFSQSDKHEPRPNSNLLSSFIVDGMIGTNLLLRRGFWTVRLCSFCHISSSNTLNVLQCAAMAHSKLPATDNNAAFYSVRHHLGNNWNICWVHTIIKVYDTMLKQLLTIEHIYTYLRWRWIPTASTSMVALEFIKWKNSFQFAWDDFHIVWRLSSTVDEYIYRTRNTMWRLIVVSVYDAMRGRYSKQMVYLYMGSEILSF